ncbi:MAG: HAD family hydrolase [Trueperaceae bacterium]
MAVTSTSRRPAVFLDKDGTLLEDVPYNVDPDEMRLTAGAGPALRRLADAGFELIVVTNQSGVARGLFPPTALRTVEWRLEELLAPFDVKLAGFHACMHHPDGIVATFARDCSCRKPKPGLLQAAASQHGIDLTSSWMVGDILNDVEAGCRAGCRTVLLDSDHKRGPTSGGRDIGGPRIVGPHIGPQLGGETLWIGGPCRTPDLVAPHLGEAAAAILIGSTERREARCDTIYSN